MRDTRTRYSVNTFFEPGKQEDQIDHSAKDNQDIFAYPSSASSPLRYSWCKVRGTGPNIVGEVSGYDFGDVVRAACHILDRDWNGLIVKVRFGGNTTLPDAIDISTVSVTFDTWLAANCVGRFLYLDKFINGRWRRSIYLENETDRLMLAIYHKGAAK